MLFNNSMFNFYKENSFAIEFRVRVGGAVGGGPFDFIVRQIPFVLVGSISIEKTALQLNFELWVGGW